ncbi:MAG: hypothetical protein AAGI27_14000 [Pseudomonadota bacterium]
MKILVVLLLSSLPFAVAAQSLFSTDDFVGDWRVEHYDAERQVTTLTEFHFDEAGRFYAQSLVTNGAATRYFDSGGNWVYQDGKVRLDYHDWSDNDVDTAYLEFENFSRQYLSFRKIHANGTRLPDIYEAHRFETPSFVHGC